MPSDLSLDITSLQKLYREGALNPRGMVEIVHSRIAGDDPHHIWITRLTREQMLAYAEALEGHHPAELPLYGIPFAIKDNIDLAQVPTTAGCPAYAYTPTESAHVVQRLVDAGAIPVGKTNLDQFATGLVGTRSPYGACRNSFDREYIAGGSSCGSAVATALGQVSFALGTDTAGSGRVPAAFNNLVGLKPTRGLLSNRGVVPACRTLDCISVFALTAADAGNVLKVAASFDPADPYSRAGRAGRAIMPKSFRFMVPRAEDLQFFGNQEYVRLFSRATERLADLGGQRIEIDFTPFREAARLLYQGPWLAERYVAVREIIQKQPEAMLSVTRSIIEEARGLSAIDAFAAMYRLAELRRSIEALLDSTDVFVTPTAGTIYRVAQVEQDPRNLNANLGYYTNFMNLLDLSAVAVPAGFDKAGLPFGITLFCDALRENTLLMLAARFMQDQALPLGATGNVAPAPEAPALEVPAGYTMVAVCGAHMSGLPLNHELTNRNGYLLATARTASCYRLYALAGGPPYRPGLVRVNEGGGSIDVELWALPLDQYGPFVTGIPAPLGIGQITLSDRRNVQGFVCEAHAVSGAKEITSLGGWRAYLTSLPA